MNRYFLTVENHQIVLKTGDRSIPIPDRETFDRIMIREATAKGIPVDDLQVMASSTLDFPEEFTHCFATITLARSLRAG